MPIQLQPIPYQGSKRSIAEQISKFFPERIERLVEPFAGSAAITLYAAHHRLASRFLLNDSYEPLMNLWRLIIANPEDCYRRYNAIWLAQRESPLEFFYKIRGEFNTDHDPVKLLFLINRCAKNAVRFNSKGEFNQSPDKRRLGKNPSLLRRSLLATSLLLKRKTEIFDQDYDQILKKVTAKDFVYLDPPYQGTSGTKNTRYHQGLSFDRLVDSLEYLNKKKVPFLLSYDGKLGDYSYGRKMPKNLNLKKVEIKAGRSAQATLNGKTDITIESLYISPFIN